MFCREKMEDLLGFEVDFMDFFRQDDGIVVFLSENVAFQGLGKREFSDKSRGPRWIRRNSDLLETTR